ncbi:MAG: hypothetical protein QOC67_3389 [Pseudonocardiales bacterium]|jgi:hypothetical protein|uniref:hypothetical protein n=1 Tax=Pseudonocardia sp. Cha107L01 TaxID=3457576 RepID=UPI0028C74C08|nr:hypothetical protein [Pseudonocardia sp.]MDT7559785.1 hypothetical protein [Pseudonocardiales bacterium]MDT7566284.1 hypothetical protein [Pseudonocardiales bacterium]MDT7586137.1 hypothetical protein [Pseudonocardiales bacterium]MDT7611176.1 hypothetical protein [Pseudonocardiales bacterium]
MTQTREVPFFDRDGEHWITLEIEVDAEGKPPEMVEIASAEDKGRQVQCQYRREHRPDSDHQWVYVEVGRTWRGEPAPGSPEALRRLLDSKEWPH